METCYGCGAESVPMQVIEDGKLVTVDEHPVVAILNQGDVDPSFKDAIENPDKGPAPDGHRYLGVPVCADCHVDPTHRTKNGLKGHFFERNQDGITRALVLAGSSMLGRDAPHELARAGRKAGERMSRANILSRGSRMAGKTLAPQTKGAKAKAEAREKASAKTEPKKK